MNWGIKIFSVYGLFVAFMIFLVALTMREDVNLVSKDYYVKELAFQGQIDKTNRTAALSEKITWRITDSEIEISLPGSNISEGEIYFFRPSDPKLDITVPVNTEPIISVPLSVFSKGMYRMKADWTNKDETYYSETIIVIP
jgi:hypothetical protein